MKVKSGARRSVSPKMWPGLALVLLLHGCIDSTVQKYKTLTKDLDGRNELYISTYPAGFPEVDSRISYLYRKQHTPNSVYFQVFVRALGKNGKNPHIESIKINSFSYYFPGQEPVVLLSDYEDNFWQQGSPQYNSVELPPVPFDKSWYLFVKIDLTVNGINYKIEERIDASTRRRFYPLLSDALR